MTEKPFSDFGSRVFGEAVMRDRLPHPIYKRFKNSLAKEEPLDKESADAIAHAMKTWALENGATHFSHWFQPMTGASAEKHDSFLQPGDDDEPMTRFFRQVTDQR